MLLTIMTGPVIYLISIREAQDLKINTDIYMFFISDIHVTFWVSEESQFSIHDPCAT